MKKKFTVIFSFLTMLMLIVSMETASASNLELTVLPDKQAYNVGEKVYINGNLTDDGSPVSDAIVAVQVDNSIGEAFIIRTLDTGSIDPSLWPLEILEVTPCDSGGNPQSSFPPNGEAGFKVKVENKAANPYDIIITLSLVYSNNAPFKVFTVYTGSLIGGHSKTITTWPVPIPYNAVTGPATVYANVYNVLPKDNGFAYCPEKSASFQIGTGGQGQPPPSGNGQFTVEIALSQILLWLGNYTIYATAKYSYLTAFSTSTFEVILIGDLIPDGMIDIKDISLVARAFGMTDEDPEWDPEKDLIQDGLIDIKDISLVARAFGTIALIP